MKKFLWTISCIVLLQCTTKKEEVMRIPDGLSIRSQFTSALDHNQHPINDVTYMTSLMSEIVLYVNFEGLKKGMHQYQYIVHNAQGQHACPQEGVYQFSVEGTGYNVWTTIQTAKCLATPGDYSVKVYLDGNWVLTKQIKVLSEEEANAGQFEAYWKNDKYMEVFPIAKSPVKGEWLVKTLGSYGSSISNLFVVTHKQLNRIFFIERVSDDDVYLKELHNYGADLVYTFPGGERDEPWNIRYRLMGDEVYFYNKIITGVFNLNTGETKSLSLPFTPPADNAFSSPSNNHVLTKNALLEGKKLVTSGLYCNEPEIRWASWNESEDKVFYSIECGEGDAYGFFMFDISKNQPQRLLEEFIGVSSPVYIQNNGSDFIYFIEQVEGQPNAIKVATQKSYFAELGFGTNFYWERAFSLPYTQENMNGAYVSVNFLSTPENYLSYRYAVDMSEKSGEIKRIGRIREGALAGKEVYRMIDEGSWYEDKGGDEAYPIKQYNYLIRNNNELIIINIPEAQQADFRIPDLDGKRRKADLFNGVTSIKHYANIFISGLLSSPLIELPDSPTPLKRVGIVERFDEKNLYRKLITHAIEGDIYVKQKDDGSFWRFNGDGTATLYQFDFNFVVNTNEGAELSMEEYVPYTNHSCLGSPLDYAHIITPDPSRLKEIGKTTIQAAVFGFASAQDDVLVQEYELLKQAYADSGQEFKSLEEFLRQVPLFLWKDPFGRYVRFIRKEYLAPTNCEPILYLYPESATEVEVSLDDKINVIAADPVLETNWRMHAEHDGTLTDLRNFKKHDYIFWEGISTYLPPLQKGFVVDTTHLDSFFDEKLNELGLIDKEIEDFKEAWLKEFKETPYYFIGFYDQSIIDKYAPMSISPEPETIIRILMDYRPLTDYEKTEVPDLKIAPKRKGFTVVEWAGLKRR